MRFCLRINEAAAGGRGEAAEVLRRAPHIVAPDLVNNAGVREIILALASPNDSCPTPLGCGTRALKAGANGVRIF
ncbi:MAG: hypothetical protein QW680_12330 [Pyrobaculum sp.]